MYQQRVKRTILARFTLFFTQSLSRTRVLTNTGKQLKAEVSIIVNIVAESRWGTITNYAAGKTVTVKIDPTKESTSIPD